MGGVFGGPKIYGDPLPKARFQTVAAELMDGHTAEYEALTECSLRYTNGMRHIENPSLPDTCVPTHISMGSKLAEPVTERCRVEIATWNLLMFESFCHRLYTDTAKCQKKAGDNWPAECKEITNELVECGDVSSRKLFQFNLEQKKAEKKTANEDTDAAKEAPKAPGRVVV